MVVFICNACGNSIKKNKVEKHYQTECPDCSVLSCIDCGKDFVGDAYQQHTSCVTEAEKYQGKLFKESDRGKPSKGEQRQQDWTQRIQEIAAAKRASGDPKIAQLLETIATYHNVPRKKAKFENFVSNSLNVHKPHILGQLWEAFADAAKQQTSGSGDRSGTEEGTVSGCETASQQATTPAMQVEEEGEKRKKKKRKHKAEEGENEEGGTEGSRGADATSDVGTTVETHTSPPPAKKKKKKKTKESEPQALDATVSAVNTDKRECSKDSDAPDPLSDADSDPSPPKKKKKKKKKKHMVDKEADVVRPVLTVCGEEEESMALATSIDQVCSAKSKKKRERPIVIEEAPLKEVEEASVAVGEIPSTVNGTDSCLMTAKKRKKHRAAVGEADSTMEEPTAAGQVLVPSSREEVEVGGQSRSSAVVMTTEGIEEVQAHKSQEAGGETSEQKHKKKKKAKSKEVIVEFVDSADLTAGDGGMEAVGVEGEDEVSGSHTKKRKSKKRHTKEDTSSGCYDNEEPSHESKAKRKKTKMTEHSTVNE